MKDNIELICDIAERIVLRVKVRIGRVASGGGFSIAEHMAADVCSIYIYDEIEQLIITCDQGWIRVQWSS